MECTYDDVVTVSWDIFSLVNYVVVVSSKVSVIVIEMTLKEWKVLIKIMHQYVEE